MENFKVGDVVQLKSGGPSMTIKQIITNGTEAHCQWFHNGEAKNDFFPIASLELVVD